MKSKFEICFVGLKCFDLLAGSKTLRYLGGVEKQLVSLARGLAGAGIKISFITYDHGQEDGVIYDGITVFKCFSPSAGLPGLRFFHPRTTGLWSAMKRADARIYIQMGGGSETGRVAMGCNGKDKKFIFFVASDADCDQSLPLLIPFRERAMYKYGLKAAQIIIAQTRQQNDMLNTSFGLDSKILPLPCTWAIKDNDYTAPTPPTAGSARVLWVGRIIEIKRLEWLIEAAEKCPETGFDIVGTPNTDSTYFSELKERASKIENIIMHGRVSDSKLSELYQQASVLSCTSIVEGFPTTFLEAWNYGLPVLTSFDPDNIIMKNGTGLVVETLEQFIESLKDLISSNEEWLKISKISRKFFCDNYTSNALLPHYQKIIKTI
jgi:glycosyltransferase involved in cell wall biosynthesis